MGTTIEENEPAELPEAERYFDWAATSPADAEILRAALDESLATFANPSSVHGAGQRARAALEGARTRCAKAIGVAPATVFFTSGGTESDHIPLLALLARQARGRIITTAIEHPALREQTALLSHLGFDVVTVNPDKSGFVQPEAVAEKITADTLFVTVMAVNNETGCVQPIADIARAIDAASGGKRRPHFHVDAVQAAGKIPLALGTGGIDSAALSAHKICGARGSGILYLAHPERFRAFLTGGGQEQGVRSGTENLFGALAFAAVLEKHFIRADAGGGAADSPAAQRLALQRAWTRDFITELRAIPQCSLVPESRGADAADDDARFSPWVVQAAFKGIPGAVMVRALDAKGFAISTGSACSAKKQSRPVLAAMGASRDVQDTAVRFSFGPLTTARGMRALLSAVRAVCTEFA